MADHCRKCGGEMREGVAMGQTFVALRPSRCANDRRTFYAGGTGRLIDCRKCAACGWSVSIGVCGSDAETDAEKPKEKPLRSTA